MNELPLLIQQGTVNLWVIIPTAILLGILHGLEPGHSKTMMASFIVAVQGTVFQAVLLGLAATLSHTAVVWIVALAGLHWGERYDVAVQEGYFQLASALILAIIAGWMLMRTWRSTHPSCDHNHDFSQFHQQPTTEHQHTHSCKHAQDIKWRVHNPQVTTGQIILFGLTGGLIPCPAAISVLLICLQLNNITMGASIVLCFSIGLALTLVAVGTFAAMGTQHLSKRWHNIEALLKYAPYLSVALILLSSIYFAYSSILTIIN